MTRALDTAAQPMSDADAPPVAGNIFAGNILRLLCEISAGLSTGTTKLRPASIRRPKERSPGRGRSGALVQRRYHDSGRS